MGVEIERKFLLVNDHWRNQTERSERQVQGYLGSVESCSIRIRVVGEQANLNIKSATLGIERQEYDYPVPLAEAEEILQHLCKKSLIEKIRHYLPLAGHVWEIDEFLGDNSGLVVAEIELADVNEAFTRPDWLGSEVSDDPRYYNVCLVEHPYSNW
ncbi:MAG: CYTH domain-containing protein [Gammaproteobacteria bacterium]